MITKLLIDFFLGLVHAVVGLLPHASPPAWVSDANGYLAGLFTGAAGLGNWIPWSIVGTVFASVLACIALGFTIKVVRIVASFFTAGGGSAA